MTDDMTYQEIKEIKSNIKEFIIQINKLATNRKLNIFQKDEDFFSFIAKHIIFFKYLYTGQQYTYFYKVLVSDLYYFVLSIIENQIRYMYVNERSIIENYMRAIMNVTIQDNHVNSDLFDEMHKKHYKCDFSDAEFSLIKSEYAVSCGYIHGGDILKESLAFVLEECACKKFDIGERKNYYDRIQRILKTFDKLLIAENSIYISSCFHRKKSVMGYLLGKEKVELLFQVLS